MPVYNEEKFVFQAIESILNQTFSNFEFIIIDDNSLDQSRKIITSFNDSRIRFFSNKKNLGITETLNIGIKKVRGQYIARMDADDIALPERLFKQYKFLRKNPHYALVGSRAKCISQFSNMPTSREPLIFFEDEQIKFWSLFYSPFIHPSILIKSKVIKEYNYDENYSISQDYHLWVRILQKYKGTNLNEVLVHHRVHPFKTSVIRKTEQLHFIKKILLLNFRLYNIEIKKSELTIHLWISNSYNHKPLSKEQLEKIENWLIKLCPLLQINSKINLSNNQIEKNISLIWYYTILKAKDGGLSTFNFFRKSSITEKLPSKNKKLLLVFFYIIVKYKPINLLFTFLKNILKSMKFHDYSQRDKSNWE